MPYKAPELRQNSRFDTVFCGFFEFHV
jgi:hypothetical protein